MRFGQSGSSKVTDFGTNQKCVCDFLLVCHSKLVLSCTVLEILQVFCAPDPTHIPPYFGCSHWTRSPILGSAQA